MNDYDAFRNAAEAGLVYQDKAGQFPQTDWQLMQGNLKEGDEGSAVPFNMGLPGNLIYRKIYMYIDEAFPTNPNAYFIRLEFKLNAKRVFYTQERFGLLTSGMKFFQTANNVGTVPHPDARIALCQNGGALLYVMPTRMVMQADFVEVTGWRPSAAGAGPIMQLGVLSSSHPF